MAGSPDLPADFNCIHGIPAFDCERRHEQRAPGAGSHPHLALVAAIQRRARLDKLTLERRVARGGTLGPDAEALARQPASDRRIRAAAGASG